MPVSATHYEQERLALADALRHLRKQAGVRGYDLAQRVDVSQSKISKIETGRLLPSVEDVRRIAAALDASPAVAADLVGRAETLLTEFVGWRLVHRRGLQRKQDDVRDLEQRATTLRLFQPTIIPGLLQTAEYARQILPSASFSPRDDIAAAVAARLERQTILFNPHRRFTFILTEAPLRQRFGTTADMLAQLDRIGSVSTLFNVKIGIIPFDSDMPRIPYTSFCIFDDDLVTVEITADEIVERDPQKVQAYVSDFALFESVALFDDRAREAIDRVAHSLRTEAGGARAGTARQSAHPSESQQEARAPAVGRTW